MTKAIQNQFNVNAAEALISPEMSLFWFRRDLRLADNAGLYRALRGDKPVLPIFIFDTCITDELESRYDRRVEFIHQEILNLQTELTALGTSLAVFVGDPCEIFKSLKPRAVYANLDYEPYATRRDQRVREILQSNNIPFFTYKDHVIFEKREVVKDDGEPYTVFTPYSRKWKSKLADSNTESFTSDKYFGNFVSTSPLPVVSLRDLGFYPTGFAFPDRRLNLNLVREYSKRRDFPALPGTSRLGIHLRFGTISIRSAVSFALAHSETWLSELIWREFYAMILSNFPHVQNHAFKPAYDRIEWRNNEHEFELWRQGLTGYPIVDAGMRELNSTGFMHNRLRMITASFLTKHLLIDWRWGEAYFAKQLLDFDLASNNGGWQWAAGTGCDASPYFRVFNPDLQTQKFDKARDYIRYWVPEYDDPKRYVAPIVEHAFARERAIKTYKTALNKFDRA